MAIEWTETENEAAIKQGLEGVHAKVHTAVVGASPPLIQLELRRVVTGWRVKASVVEYEGAGGSVLVLKNLQTTNVDEAKQQVAQLARDKAAVRAELSRLLDGLA